MLTAAESAPLGPAATPRKPDATSLASRKQPAMDALCGVASRWLAGRGTHANLRSGPADNRPDPQRAPADARLVAPTVPPIHPLADIDPEVMAWLAAVHGVEPFLHGVVAGRVIEGALVPVEVRERWRHAYFVNAALNSSVLEELAALTDACEKASAPVVVLKGFATARRAFGDVGLRTMSDIDILCRPKDCARVAGLARELGFMGGEVTSTVHTQLLHERLPTSLEIHFGGYDFFPDRHGFVESALREREKIGVDSVTLPAMRAPLHAAFDLAHLVHHDFIASLQRWLEVAAELRLLSISPDWPLLLTEVRRMGIEPELSSAWSVMAVFFGEPMRECSDVPGLTVERADADLPGAARAAMLSIEGSLTDQPLAEAGARPRGMGRARFLARLLVPDRAALSAAYEQRPGSVLRSRLQHLRSTIGRGWGKLRGRAHRQRSTAPASLGVKRRVYARKARVSGD